MDSVRVKLIILKLFITHINYFMVWHYGCRINDGESVERLLSQHGDNVAHFLDRSEHDRRMRHDRACLDLKVEGWRLPGQQRYAGQLDVNVVKSLKIKKTSNIFRKSNNIIKQTAL